MNTTASLIPALQQQSMPPFQNASNATMAFPTLDPLPVTLVRRSLSPEAVIGIVCGVCGVLVPIVILVAKYLYKRHKDKVEGGDAERVTDGNV